MRPMRGHYREVLPWHGTERLCGKCFDAISDEKVADAQRRELEQLDVSQLLDDVAAYIRRYVAMSAAQGATLALWVLHTHALEAVRVTPYIWVTSPEAGSGKTLLLEVLETVVPRPWLTGRTTAAVLPRKVDKEQPTLLLDESDAGFGGNKEYAEALRGILNTGYKQSGRTSVCVGQGASIGYADLSTFCPKVIAGLGKLPDTVRDRAIRIRLDKLAPDEEVEEFDEETAEPVALFLRGRLEDFGAIAVPHLKGKRPECPSGFSPRMKEIVRPLLAVADLAGGEWPQRALRALCELTDADAGEDKSAGVELLSDVRDAFESLGVDRISTKDLREHLIAMEERPWCEWRRGDPITQRGLARLLKPYDIIARSIRLEDGRTPKGFLREQFEDAWRRHLPQEPQSYPPHRHNGSTKPDSALSHPPQEAGCGGYETPENPHEQANVALWRIEDPPKREREPDAKVGNDIPRLPPIEVVDNTIDGTGCEVRRDVDEMLRERGYKDGAGG